MCNSFTSIEAAMNSSKVNIPNVQCRTSKSLVDTFVEDETVNRQNYLQMLNNYFYPMIYGFSK